MKTPIADFVREYSRQGMARLHMPGHKGVPLLGCEPYDITEIKGADELYAPDGIIAQSEKNATALFGSGHTYYSAEGSSQCIRAMLFLALQAAERPAVGRPVLLAARNAHKALLYACALLDIEVEWLWPGETESLCSCPIGPETLAEVLVRLRAEGRTPFGIYLTSPDYLGGMQDIAALSAAAKPFGVPVLVDNAHGAYLAFLKVRGENRHPMAQGAAICCDSAHKTLPVLTGGAYLHLAPDFPADAAAVRGALCLFGSTSPSYLILQSLDLCNAALAGEYPTLLSRTAGRVAALRIRLNEALPGIALPVEEPLKLVLDAHAVGCTGEQLAEQLRSGGVECEYADRRHLVLMVSPGNPPQDDGRVARALSALTPGKCAADVSVGPLFACLREELAQAEGGCSIRQAVFAGQEWVSPEEAVGRICALPAVSCPPAIPIVVSGERIPPAAAALMKEYGISGLHVVRE